MKKYLTVFLVLAICLTASACGKNEKEEVQVKLNPIVGVWEFKSDSIENTFIFEEKNGQTEGSYRYYDYANSKWGEFTFKVKEQTENRLTLLVDDGTLDEINYCVWGDHLYIDGTLYTNNKTEIPVFEDYKNRMLIVDSEPFSIYKGIFTGMYIDDVQEAFGLGHTMEWKVNGDGKPSYASIWPDDETFYCVDLSLDKNQCLRYIKGQGHYDEQVCNSWISNLTMLFGPYKYGEHTYYPDGSDVAKSVFDTYTWSFEQWEFEMWFSTDIGENAPDYFTLSCEHKD